MGPQQGVKDTSKKRYRRVKSSQKSGTADGYGALMSAIPTVNACPCAHMSRFLLMFSLPPQSIWLVSRCMHVLGCWTL